MKQEEIVQRVEQVVVPEDLSLVAPEPRPNIPPGDYVAACIRIEPSDYRTNPKLCLVFRITEGEYTGLELSMFLNLSEIKEGRPSPATRFYQNWVVANFGRRPQRGDRMPLKVFKGGTFLVAVRDAKPRHYDGAVLPESMKYSVIDHLVERIPDAGY
jgi:hypothetical protein